MSAATLEEIRSVWRLVRVRADEALADPHADASELVEMLDELHDEVFGDEADEEEEA